MRRTVGTLQAFAATAALALTVAGFPSAAAHAADGAANCTGIVKIVSLTFDPPTTAGGFPPSRLELQNCTAENQKVTIQRYATLSGPTSGIPAGCAVIDPVLVPASLPPNGSYTSTFSFGEPAGCTATSMRVNVTVTAEADGSTTSQSATVTLGADPTACKVAYARQAEWPGGFVAAVTITNTAATTVQGWSLSFRFSGDQQVTQAWNAVLTQSSGTVTATNTGYNATVAAGASVTFGLLGTWHAADPSPTAFTLNGRSCTIAA